MTKLTLTQMANEAMKESSDIQVLDEMNAHELQGGAWWKRALKIGGKALGPIGWGLTAYELYQETQKNHC